MYSINKEYKNQKVVCFFADGSSIKLDEAKEKDFEKIYKVKGYQKFIDKKAKK